MNADFPDKLSFLFEPHPYKVVFGGRDGIKSWSFAAALLIMGVRSKLRILCARETQKSITDSVHKLLADQIIRLKLQRRYTVQQASILGKNGTEFFFAGLKHNVSNIKSAESIDIVWVEEAQTVSKDSWEVLIPTIRKAGSEIWIAFNPELDTDDTYLRWVLNPPPGAIVMRTGYQDNLWLSEESKIKIAHLQATDPRAFAHVYGGETKTAVEGAIYEDEIRQAETEGRITHVPWDRSRPVHTCWDLGFGDSTAIWFVQTIEPTLAAPQGAYRVIDYLENSGKTIEWYVIQLNNKGYQYGEDWFPHDGVDTIIHAKFSGDKTRSPEMLARAAGRKVRIAPKMHITSGINAARTIFPRCWFDAQHCADGLQGLRHYQWGPIATSGAERREPLHNWASHPADAFRAAAVALKLPEPIVVRPEVPRPRVGAWS